MRALKERGQLPVEVGMVYRLGRALQVMGMCLLPVAMAGNVVDPQFMTLGRMLMVTTLGIVIFMIGRSISGTGQGN